MLNSHIYTMPSCEQCGLNFSRNFCLQRHQRCHHGQERHECIDCHKIYVRRDNLQKHRAKRHQSSIPTTRCRALPCSSNEGHLGVDQLQHCSIQSQAACTVVHRNHGEDMRPLYMQHANERQHFSDVQTTQEAMVDHFQVSSDSELSLSDRIDGSNGWIHPTQNNVRRSRS